MSLLETTLAQIVPQDDAWRCRAKERLDQLIMPHWALGRLMDLAVDLAGMTRSLRPPTARKTIVTMAGDHGVAAEGVSKYPQEVTPQMVLGFVGGMAGINALGRLAGARVVVVDMGVAADLGPLAAAGKIIAKKVAPGTANIAKGPAMTRAQAVQAIAAGIEVVAALADSTDVFGTGDMGIANTTPSTAVVAAITGEPVAALAGRGTGIDDEQLTRKIAAVEAALAVNRPDARDGLDVLAKVGGFEIGGIAGVILAAAARRKPVVVDGFISTAGALIAQALCPAAIDYVVAAHRSAEQGHRTMQRRLGKEPLLDLNLRLGEGSGAALAMNLVEAAQRILTEVATFDEATSPRPTHETLPRGNPLPHHPAAPRRDWRRGVRSGRQRALLPRRRAALGRPGRGDRLGNVANRPADGRRRGGCCRDAQFLRMSALGRPVGHGRRIAQLPQPSADAGDYEGQPCGSDGSDRRGVRAAVEIRLAGVAGAGKALARRVAHAPGRPCGDLRPPGGAAAGAARGAGGCLLCCKCHRS